MKNKIACVVTQGLLALVAWKAVEKTIGDKKVAQWPTKSRIAAAAIVPVGLLFADTLIERKFKVTNLDLFGSNAD